MHTCTLIISILLLSGLATPVSAAEPWIINVPVTVTSPMDVSDVIVVSGGSLVVSGVPEPGFRISGNFITAESGQARFQDSVIQFMSTYHGQYTLVAMDNSIITVSRCDYRVPDGVLHGLVSVGNGLLVIKDTDFLAVQLVATGTSTLKAFRLNGMFEVILADQAQIVLQDIPRNPGKGNLWVWPEFSNGSKATYSPPMPGFIEEWSFPPKGSSGIQQRCWLRRCRVKLWPMLVRAGCDLTLSDIATENWIVVGFHLPNSVTIKNLANGMAVDDVTLSFPDRKVRVLRSTIDTFNLYPENNARVTVQDSRIGEMLAFDQSLVYLRSVRIDGSGGYFGAIGTARVDAENCTFTCDVQASDNATVLLNRSQILPYPADPTGTDTRFGAFDMARLLLNATSAYTTAVLGNRGLVAVSGIQDPPQQPPGPGKTTVLRGSAVLYSLDSSVAPGKWRLEVVKAGGGTPNILGQGQGDLVNGLLGKWTNADPSKNYQLRIMLTDLLGRRLVGRTNVPPSQIAARKDERLAKLSTVKAQLLSPLQCCMSPLWMVKSNTSARRTSARRLAVKTESGKPLR